MTTWQICFRALLPVIVLLILISLSGCADDRFARAVMRQADAEQVSQALGVADAERRTGRALPSYPASCRRTHRSGVRAGDRLDAALVKTDRALARANGQISACAGWYDDFRKGVVEAESPNAIE